MNALRPAVFFDRDGTLIAERHYLKDPAHVALLPGVAASLQRVRRAGFACVVVTNQSGIGRGLLTEDDLHDVNREFLRHLHRLEADVDAIYFCPQAPGGGDHPERKPAPGMLLRAARELGLDIARSWMVGDKSCDLHAGQNAGCKGSLLVRTGHALDGDVERWQREGWIVDDVPAAVDRILQAHQ